MWLGCHWLRPRQVTILKQSFRERKCTGGRSPLEDMVPLEKDLGPEQCALSVRVTSSGRPFISLVAVRFEYEPRELEPKR